MIIYLADKKKKKEEAKVAVKEVKEVKEKIVVEEEKKKEKPKAHAPSHTKIRSIGNLPPSAEPVSSVIRSA